MLAKKFRLPIKRNKNKKTITKKGNFFIVKVSPNELDFSRFGVIISSKIFKKSTERNRLKRMIFNCIHSSKLHQFPGRDALIVVQLPARSAGKAEIEKELKMLLS